MNYCDKCKKMVEGKIITKDETYKVKFEKPVTVKARVMTCEICGE